MVYSTPVIMDIMEAGFLEQQRDPNGWQVEELKEKYSKGRTRSSYNCGINFIQHPCNGLEGFPYDYEIGVEDSIGYAIVPDSDIDSSKIYITKDYFENFEVQYLLYLENTGYLRRGTNNGELFLIGGTPKLISYSDDYGES